jgi:hypothetical protein
LIFVRLVGWPRLITAMTVLVLPAVIANQALTAGPSVAAFP